MIRERGYMPLYQPVGHAVAFDRFDPRFVGIAVRLPVVLPFRAPRDHFGGAGRYLQQPEFIFDPRILRNILTVRIFYTDFCRIRGFARMQDAARAGNFDGELHIKVFAERVFDRIFRVRKRGAVKDLFRAARPHDEHARNEHGERAVLLRDLIVVAHVRAVRRKHSRIDQRIFALADLRL